MLLGRESELVALVAGVQRARAARAAVIVVRGEPGIGKTALLSELEQQAPGFRVLKAHGVASESALAYAGLTELLAPVLDLLPRLPGRRRTALEAALGLGAEIVNDPFGAYAATLSLLAEAADEQPVLALVDDAHLLDAESAHALRFSGRRLTDDRVCLVLAMREGEGVDFESSGFEQVRLGGLNLDATHALLGEASPDVLDRLHEGTQGNPLALRELGRLLSPAQLHGRDRLPDLLPAGPGITRAFGDRIDALPPATREALVVAAADGSGQMGTLLEALRARDLDLDALTPAEAADLITVEAGRLSFVHPLIRTTAYQRATPVCQRAAHRALADAADGDPASRARRAWHLAAATIEPDEHVADELDHVALEAGTRAAPAIAGRAYETAARVSLPGPARGRRLLQGAQAYHNAGAADAALGLLDALMSENEDPLIRADAQRLRAQVGSFRETTGSVCALLVDEAERVDPHDPLRAALLRLDASMVSMMRGEPRIAEQLSERAWAVAQHAQPALRAYAALVVGGTRVLRGDARSGAALVHEAAEHFERNDIGSVGLFAGQLVFAELAAGRSEFGRERAQRVVDALRAAGMLPTLPSALVGLAWSLMFAGDWIGAVTAAEESMAMAQELGLPAFESQPLTILTLIAGPQGRFAEGRRLIADALGRGLEHGVESIRTMAGWALGRLELSVGDLDAAVVTLEQTGRFTLERGMECPGIAPWAQDLTESFVRLGRHGEARATLLVLERQTAYTQVDGRANAGVCRCRGLLSDDEDIDRHFRDAIEWHERAPDPFERARTELCYGERLRRTGRRNDARAELRCALSAFDELGAEPWARRAEAELNRSGERARRRTPDTADQLTPQERQVAALVAQGVTNREAAAALFVSPKTIETHLSHVYRKLGVRSRAELAHRFAATAASD